MNTIRRNCGGSDGIRLFISEIQNRPVLWDPSYVKYSPGDRFSYRKKELFEDILKGLGWIDKVSVETAQQAWKYLKGQYFTEKANFTRNNAENGASQWEFLSSMSFLDKAISSVSTVSPAEERTDYPRRTARYACAVPTCSNTEKSIINQRPVQFFDMPDGKDRRLRQKWQQAVPELESAVSPAHQKVCEFHFANGRPTDDSPFPTLNLGDDISMETKVSRKRKITQNAGENNKTKVPSLDSVLQAVADSALKREKELLGELDSTEPIKIPESTSAVAKLQTGQTKLVKLPLKALKTLSGAKLGTNFKIIKATNGGTGFGTPQKVIISASGERTRIVQLVKPSTNLSAAKHPTVSSSGVAQPKSLEEALMGLAANAPSASDIAGTVNEIVQINDRLKKQIKKEIKEEPSSTICENAEIPGTSNQNFNDSNDPSVLDAKSPDEAASKPMTLMSALQSIGSFSANVNEPVTSSSSSFQLPAPSLGNPVSVGHEVTCSKCANDLPVLRRSLGRLESRVDSMITMVKTLCARQASLEYASKKQRPPVVLRPRIIPSVVAAQANNASISRGGITATGNITPAKGIIKSPATTVVHLGASASKTSSILQNPKSGSNITLSKLSGITTPKSVTITAHPSSVVHKGKSSKPILLPATKHLDESSSAERSSRDSSPDTMPPSLSTKFMPAPKQPDASISYLHKTVIRSLLLFNGPQFTIAEFRAAGPAIARDVSTEKLRESVEKLLQNGLLRRINDTEDLADDHAAYEKERQNCKLSGLIEYGITKEQYKNRLEKLNTN